MRLAKFLAHAGVASRRSAETLIAAGRVSVAGEVVSDPARDVDEDSEVALDGRAIAGPEPRVLYALNKPPGVISSARDTHGRPTVVELVPAEGLRLYPVGRLDVDTSGLILLTNDGELANRLTHPRFQVPKTYRAKLRGGPVGAPALEALRAGVQLEDGPTAPAQVRRLGASEIELTIREGRNRQVRRMCQAVGHPVLELQRTRFGPLSLAGLALGEHRRLEQSDLTVCVRSRSDRIAAMRLFALRGAISVERNDAQDILDATSELMRQIMSRNELAPERVVSCIFTATKDLNAEFPAVAARALGFDRVPLLCAQEIPVPRSMSRVIRVLIHYHADDDHEPFHVYLGEASGLRADLSSAQ